MRELMPVGQIGKTCLGSKVSDPRYFTGWLLSGLLLLLFLATPATAEKVELSDTLAGIDLLGLTAVYEGTADPFPAGFTDIAHWELDQIPVTRPFRTLGGDYWLVLRFRTGPEGGQWVIAPRNSLIENFTARLYAPDEDSVAEFSTGYGKDLEYIVAYGARVHLQPDTDYVLVAHQSSRVYQSIPRLEFHRAQGYEQVVLHEIVIVLLCLGALLTLALYNLFIYWGTRDRSHLFYSLYMLTYLWGWSHQFNVPEALFGIQWVRAQMIPFALLPLLNGLFVIHFLKLRVNNPLLGKLILGNGVIAVLVLPFVVHHPGLTHAWATIVISIWILLALTAGILAWRRGFRPARYFVFAFIALLIPAIIILPGNLGLIANPVENAELLTLLGGTIDGILLAFALADKYRLTHEQNRELAEHLEVMVDARTRELAEANRRLEGLVHIDELTGAFNRRFFIQRLDQEIELFRRRSQPLSLIMLDVDDFKMFNDTWGHDAGDSVLRVITQTLEKAVRTNDFVCRIGGEEFAVILTATQEEESLFIAERIRDHIARLNDEPGTVSFGASPRLTASIGVTTYRKGMSRDELIKRADDASYEAKRKGKDCVVGV